MNMSNDKQWRSRIVNASWEIFQGNRYDTMLSDEM